MLKAFDSAKKQKKWSANFPTSTVAGNPVHEQEEPRGAEAISFEGKVNQNVAAVLKRIHQNLGHPPNRELIRRLRLSGASAAVLQAAEQMVCKTCNKSTKAKSSRTAHPAVVLDFNEVVAADVIWLDTLETTGLPALNVVDVASTYQVVLPLENTTAQHVGDAFVKGWVNWAGAPKHLIVDLDSAFKGDFPADPERQVRDSPVCSWSSTLAKWDRRKARRCMERDLEETG